jgi:hypothetical protein
VTPPTSPRARLDIAIRPRHIVRACWIVTLFIVVLATYLMAIKYGRGRDFVYGLTARFDMDQEWGIPSLFSGLQLLFNAGLFAVAWMATKDGANRSRMWLLLSLFFVYLSIDEVFSVHEQLIVPIRERWELPGRLDYAWMIPYGTVVALIGLAFFHVWRRQTTRVRSLLGLAAVVYVAGAIGVDLVGETYLRLRGNTLSYALIVELEETLEMAGLIVLMQTLFGIIRETGYQWRVAISGQDVDAPTTT